MTDELKPCPQFGIVGAVCSDPETLCDQYIFCKRARELQKEPSELPEWVKKQLDTCPLLDGKTVTYQSGVFDTLDWFLTLRKPEVKNGSI